MKLEHDWIVVRRDVYAKQGDKKIWFLEAYDMDCDDWEMVICDDFDLDEDEEIDQELTEEEHGSYYLYDDKPIEGLISINLEQEHIYRNGWVVAIRDNEEWLDYYQSENFRRESENCTVCDAIFTINREAKRLRDLASDNWNCNDKAHAGELSSLKKYLYHLKGQAIAYLVQEGQLQLAGGHIIGGNYFACYTDGKKYTFHSPAPGPDNIDNIDEIEEIAAKPFDENEPGILQAIDVLKNYLQDKEEIELFELPVRQREKVYWCDDDDDDDYYGDDNDEGN